MLFCAVGIPFYFISVLVSAYAVNGAGGFFDGFWQMFTILSLVNLIDQMLIDEYRVGCRKAREIPGNEDMKPYINKKEPEHYDTEIRDPEAAGKSREY